MPGTLLEHPNLIMLPRILMIENTNICNLDCRLCSSQRQERSKGMMSLDQFKSIIDQIKGHVDRILLGFMGEPLLNRDVWKQVKYATENGIDVHMPSNATMLHLYSYDEIFDSGIKKMNVALDGATKETHEYYRRHSNFDKTVQNIKNLCEEKRRRGLKYPEIILQFIVFKHNEHEIQKIKDLAKHVIKPDVLYLKTAALWAEPAHKKKEDLHEEWLPKNKDFRRYGDDGIQLKKTFNICPFTFDSALITWNGDCISCCFDVHGKNKVGNIFEKPFAEVFRSPEYMALRKRIAHKEMLMCKNCDLATGDHYGDNIPYEKINATPLNIP